MSPLEIGTVPSADEAVSADSDSVNPTQSTASISVPPPVTNHDERLTFNTVEWKEYDPLIARRTQLESKKSLMIPRDLLPEKQADVIRPRR